jgi:hypothetical protein
VTPGKGSSDLRRTDEEIAENLLEIHNFMNVQYRSFRNAWIAFNIPSIAAGMLIFTVVLIDLLIRIV